MRQNRARRYNKHFFVCFLFDSVIYRLYVMLYVLFVYLKTKDITVCVCAHVCVCVRVCTFAFSFGPAWLLVCFLLGIKRNWTLGWTQIAIFVAVTIKSNISWLVAAKWYWSWRYWPYVVSSYARCYFAALAATADAATAKAATAKAAAAAGVIAAIVGIIWRH